MDDEPKRNLRIAGQEVLNALNGVRKLRGLAPLEKFPLPPYCSFCGEGKDAVGALLEGRDAYICDRCAREAKRDLLGKMKPHGD